MLLRLPLRVIFITCLQVSRRDFDVLDGARVLFCGLTCFESGKILAFSCPWSCLSELSRNSPDFSFLISSGPFPSD